MDDVNDFGKDSKFGHFPFSFGCDISELLKDVNKWVHHCTNMFEGWIPYDIEERDDQYIIMIPLPGLTKEDVEISLIGRELNIKTKRKTSEVSEVKQHENKKKHPYWGHGFIRNFLYMLWKKGGNATIQLPDDADENSVKSTMANGLLKVKLGKKPSKRVDVNVE